MLLTISNEHCEIPKIGHCSLLMAHFPYAQCMELEGMMNALEEVGLSGRVRRVIFSEYLVFWLSLVYLLAMGPFTPGFFTQENFGNILATFLPLFIVATGQTIVLISGGIDLSVTSIIAITSVVGAMMMNAGGGWLAGSVWATPAGVILMLSLGTAFGLLNGVAVTQLKMPPFIVTLTAMMFLSGLSVWLTKSKNINDLPAAFNALGG